VLVVRVKVFTDKRPIIFADMARQTTTTTAVVR